MSFAIALVPLFILVLLSSVLLKSAALITRTKLYWKFCFGYGGLVAIISIATKAIIVASNYAPPLFLALSIGGVLHLTLGSWYVAKFGQNKEENRISVVRAFITMLIFLLLLSLLVSGFMFLATIARSSQQH